MLEGGMDAVVDDVVSEPESTMAYEVLASRMKGVTDQLTRWKAGLVLKIEMQVYMVVDDSYR